MNKATDTFTLRNGVNIPCIGLGTWQTPDGATIAEVVQKALSVGYQHIDTAAFYGNEKGIGRGIVESGVKREDIFITSKVWNTERGYNKTKEAFEKTCSNLGVEYLDLYLIHWPASENRYEMWEQINLDTWKAMTELYQEGRIRAIGVSNFMPHHLDALLETEVKPMVNQIEFHPGQLQQETVGFCKENDIIVEAWSPLGTGKMLENETLKEIASNYQKSVAQLCIRWCLQNGVLPLPKSATPSRIEENANVFDFIISEDDMKAINEIPYFGGSGLHPDQVRF